MASRTLLARLAKSAWKKRGHEHAATNIEESTATSINSLKLQSRTSRGWEEVSGPTNTPHYYRKSRAGRQQIVVEIWECNVSPDVKRSAVIGRNRGCRPARKANPRPPPGKVDGGLRRRFTP